MQVDAQTTLVALLGYPVEHSLSPFIHNTAFRRQGVNAVYLALPVRPDDVREAVAGLRALGFLGANVTIPHKQAVLPFLDALSAQAQAVGAVNTIVCRRRDAVVELHGDNTDVAGFLAPLREATAELDGASMVIFGAGGAARAAAYALLTTYRPGRLTLVARTTAKAERLAGDLVAYDARGALHVNSFDGASAEVREALLLVNATPLGMHPNVDATPWADAGCFRPGQIAYDLVYNPEETRFLREASRRGARTVGGLGMLVGQAAAAYQQWTGREMPLDAVYEALQKR